MVEGDFEGDEVALVLVLAVLRSIVESTIAVREDDDGGENTAELPLILSQPSRSLYEPKDKKHRSKFQKGGIILLSGSPLQPSEDTLTRLLEKILSNSPKVGFQADCTSNHALNLQNHFTRAETKGTWWLDQTHEMIFKMILTEFIPPCGSQLTRIQVDRNRG